MRALISVMFLVIFALAVIIGILGLLGTILGLTFGALGVVIGFAFKLVFSPLILAVIAAYVVFRFLCKNAAK